MMIVLKEKINSENKNYYYISPPNFKKNIENCKTSLSFCDFDTVYVDYDTADILFIDDDPIIRTLFDKKMKKVKIKKDKDDEGRLIKMEICNTSNKLLSNILEYKSTYGLIVIDENLGPDNLTGTQCIHRLRKFGYNGPIISITCGYKQEMVNKIKSSGSNGIVIKNRKDFYSEIINILMKLVKRKL